MTLNDKSARCVKQTLTNRFNWTAVYPNYSYTNYAIPHNITFVDECFLYVITVTNTILITSTSYYKQSTTVRGDIAQKVLSATSSDYIVNINPTQTSQTITSIQNATYLRQNTNSTLSCINDISAAAKNITNNIPIYYLECQAPNNQYAPQITFDINTTIDILYFYIA